MTENGPSRDIECLRCKGWIKAGEPAYRMPLTKDKALVAWLHPDCAPEPRPEAPWT